METKFADGSAASGVIHSSSGSGSTASSSSLWGLEFISITIIQLPMGQTY